MLFNKKHGNFLASVISQWERDGVVDPATATALKNSYQIRSFDWGRLAKWSFVIALVCAVIGFGAIVADKQLAALIMRFIDAPDSFLCAFFGCLAAAAFFLGYLKRRRQPRNILGNEALLFLGVVSAATSIGFLGRVLDTGNGHFSLLLLLAAVLYGVIGLWFASKLVWIFALLSLGSWFGAETGYVSGWGMYYFGMNYPLRFALFGAALTGASFLFRFGPTTRLLRGSTFKIGLLYLFASLWILSIFGNYGDWSSWHGRDKAALLAWSVLFGLAALLAVWYGLKHDDGAARGFGLTFLFINLYTKYFEYFWDSLHKAVFFLVLAVSFWLIGRKAEAIWNLEFVGKNAPRDDDGIA